MEEPRILVAARLSRVVKGRDQVSIERQDTQAEAYAHEHDRVIVATAADAGVSGSISPFKRPALGPYLTQPELVDSWDEIVASALDRLGRNARDLAELRDFAEDHEKRITILSPRLHWPPAEDDFASGLIWDVLGRLAEIELRLTRKRYADSRAFLRDRRSMIGKPVWGFKIVGSKADKTLTPDPAKVAYLLRMVDMALAGESQNDIARWLDSERVSPRHGGQWSAKSVGQILRSESLYGVHRDGGKVLLRHQGVISKARWDQLQAKLDANPKRRGPTRNDPMMLTDVIYCGTCQRIMHARRTPGKPRNDGSRLVWEGYRCDGTPKAPSTCKNWVRADDIQAWVDLWFTIPADAGGSGFADVEILETVRVPAKGYADEVADLESQIRDLDLDDPDYDATHAALRGERSRLIALGTEPAHTVDRPTGILLGDYWPTLTVAEKRDYLRRSGLKVYASKSDRWVEGDPHKVIGALARK